MTDKQHITLTYLNIRQSISILLFKLVFIDLLLAALVFLYYFFLVQGEQFIRGISLDVPFFIIVFSIAGFCKILLSCYVVLEWLHEYYEITPEYILHKHGIVFRKTEHYRFNHVRAMKIHYSFLGGLFNFATISLYDIRLNKYLDMYLIHNARRYAKIIRELRPQIEMKQDQTWVPNNTDEDVIPTESL